MMDVVGSPIPVHSRDPHAGRITFHHQDPQMTQQSTRPDVLGELLDVLSHPHRRRILTRLEARNPRDEDEFDLEELTGDEGLDDETLSLVHNHLPKLADSGFIDWDRAEQVVTRGSRFHEIEPLIELMNAHQDELPADWP